MRDFADNGAMRSSRHRGLAGLWLGLWILAACSGQWIQLHVAIGHADDGHHETHGVAALLDHYGHEAHSDHDHELSSAVDDRARPGSRPHLPASSPATALLPIEWQQSAVSAAELSAPTPRPRGTPPGLRNPHILRI